METLSEPNDLVADRNLQTGEILGLEEVKQWSTEREREQIEEVHCL